MRVAERALGAVAVMALSATAAARAPTCPSGKDWPARIRIEYDVTASKGPFSISGDSILVFERQAAAYTVNIDTDSTLLYHAHQTSRGTIEPGGLRPLEYVEVRTRRDPQTTTFDWNTKSVRFSVSPDMDETQPGLQDRASLLLQIAWLYRAAAPRVPFEIPVAGARRVGPYHFKPYGMETVKVPVGTVEAVRIERAEEDGDKLEAWLGTHWCGLPVRIRYTDHKGGVIDHRMRAAQIE